jgi:hypothetical protein
LLSDRDEDCSSEKSARRKRSKGGDGLENSDAEGAQRKTRVWMQGQKIIGCGAANLGARKAVMVVDDGIEEREKEKDEDGEDGDA